MSSNASKIEAGSKKRAITGKVEMPEKSIEVQKSDSNVEVNEIEKMPTIAVVAQRRSEQIDRSAYDVRSDILTPNSSVADVIANLPNITVEQDGKVAVRGNQNTQIFVDGKRSAMFSGPNSGDALNTFPASALESVEVITTPGVEFGSEGGSGPILNLVTKRIRPPGGRGALTAGAGAKGRGNISFTGSYNVGRVQLEGQGGINRTVTIRNGWSTQDSQIGQDIWLTHRISSGKTALQSLSLNPKLIYNIKETDQVNLGLNFNHAISENTSREKYLILHGEEFPYEDYLRSVSTELHRKIYMFTLGFERRITSSDQISIDLRKSGNASYYGSHNQNAYIITGPSGPRFHRRNTSDQANYLTEIIIDLRKSVSSTFNYKAGLKVGYNNGQSDASYFDIDPLTDMEVYNVNHISSFRATELVLATYFASNFRLNESLLILPGIRYESYNRRITYIAQQAYSKNVDGEFLPSLHVEYAPVSHEATFVGAYSRRVDRPKLSDINPNIQYINDQSSMQGDPFLKPTYTNKYDIKYVDTWFGTKTNINFYREVSSPLLGSVLTTIPGSTAILSKAVNFGQKATKGISLDFQSASNKSLNLGATVNIRNVSQGYLATAINADGKSYTFESARAIISKNLQVRALYSEMRKHTFQLNGNYTGRTLSGLYETEPRWQVLIGWTWRITSQISLRASIADLFNSNVNKYHQTANAVTLASYNRQQGRVVALALTCSLGGVTGDAQVRKSRLNPLVVPSK